jgi:hypothetical protein
VSKAIAQHVQYYVTGVTLGSGSGQFQCPPTNAPDNPTGLYADNTDCTHFYQCHDGAAGSIPCPPHLEFNPTLRVCDYPESSGCTAPNHLAGSRRRRRK